MINANTHNGSNPNESAAVEPVGEVATTVAEPANDDAAKTEPQADAADAAPVSAETPQTESKH